MMDETGRNVSLSKGGENNMITSQNSPECSCYVNDVRSDLDAFIEAIKIPSVRKEIIAILEEAGLLPLSLHPLC